jgi:hypothetical protein
VQPVKQALVKYLRDAATNNTDDITKFSQASYRAALRSLGDAKLKVFFDPAELSMLKNVGEAAKYMQAQPTGSAVNSSNSGAMLIGRGIDLASSVTGKLPLGLNTMVTGTMQGLQQRQALNPVRALALPMPKSDSARFNPIFASLLARPVDKREDERGN